MNVRQRIEFEFNEEKLYLTKQEYAGNHALAIGMFDAHGIPYGRISVNIPGKSENLPENHFYCKDFDEYEDIVAKLTQEGLLMWISAIPSAINGHCLYNVYRLTPKALRGLE